MDNLTTHEAAQCKVCHAPIYPGMLVKVTLVNGLYEYECRLSGCPRTEKEAHA